MSTVRAALAEACRRLAAATPSPRIDADCLLQHVLQKDRAWLRTHDDAVLNTEESRAFAGCIERRLRGEPVAYITGARGFWSLELQVGPGVLIPRPETELLVERALELIPAVSALRVLDLGTGSGAIALAVKKERPRCEVTAVDASPAALEIAAANARRLGLAVTLRESDWFSALAGTTFDIVLSNPPYIAPDDAHLLQGDLRFEPRRALAAAETGLQALRRIAEAAPSHLATGGWLLMEHGYDQGAAVRALLAQQGFAQIATRRDLGGHERFTEGCLPC
jgi:release factor glutamine methyltransferase